jgi:hypothetical protein
VALGGFIGIVIGFASQQVPGRILLGKSNNWKKLKLRSLEDFRSQRCNVSIAWSLSESA